MRRVYATLARPDMVLGLPIHDTRGAVILDAGAKLTESSLKLLQIHWIGEVFIEDSRVADVPVQPLYPPGVEAAAVSALHQLLTEARGAQGIEDGLLEPLETLVYTMTRVLFPEVIGEPNVSGCRSMREYPFVQPVRVAGLALLLGKRLGLEMFEMALSGMAALMKDNGAVALPPGLMEVPNPSESDLRVIRQHPVYGAEIIGSYEGMGPEVAEAVYHHHERWDGSGYPEGLKGEQIPLYSRVIAVADTYYELVSQGIGDRALMPHEAAEYVMAYSGELFDPDVVEVLARHVSLYPVGVSVKLNTGEIGIVSDGNAGHVTRPVVRICFDEGGEPYPRPFDVDLSRAEYQRRVIVTVI